MDPVATLQDDVLVESVSERGFSDLTGASSKAAMSKMQLWLPMSTVARSLLAIFHLAV